ncbi:MAG: RNA-binding protein [Acidobacteria bacterium]|nr:RNA-binding protein [Acidobacteriota bacterium]
MKNLFVGNLPFSASETDLRALFERFGAVDRVSVITDRETGKSRGFGFVEMTDEDAATKAIAGLNGTEIGGRVLSVSEAKPKTDRAPGARVGEGARRGSQSSGQRW